MRHRFAFFAVLAALVLAAAGCAGDASSGQAAAPATTAAAPAAAGPPATHTETIRHAPKGLVPTGRREPAPGLRVTAFDGREIDLAQWKGQLVVVNFFESWCVVCRAEQDALTEVSRRFEHQVRFVGVSNHDTVSEGRKYQRHFGVPYPLANDSSGRTWAAYRVPYQPVTVVVDERGRVVRRWDGEVEPVHLASVLKYLVDG